jgi:uncharacterized protein (DUF433 family)
VTFPVGADEAIYTIAEAARLLRLKPNTLRYWLEGMTRKGYRYEPVIRREPTGSGEVSWPEFIEAGWLSEYRQAKVPLPELREFVIRARDEFGVEYPFATEQPLTSGRDLLRRIQDDSGLPHDLRLVRYRDEQLVLTEIANAFVSKVEFAVESTGAIRYWPRGRDKLVVIDPLVNYGAPTVNGIRTEALFEQIRAGQDFPRVASDWGIDVTVVQRACEWELWDPRAKTAA